MSNDPNEVIWGFPLDLADWESWAVAHRPWRHPGETLADYLARIVPAFPDHSTEEIARWFEHTSTYPA